MSAPSDAPADLPLDMSRPFVLINREDGPQTLVLSCHPCSERALLADIPRLVNKGNRECTVGGLTYDSVSMVPFSQIKERGFKARSRGEQILSLQVASARQVETRRFAELLPKEEIELCEEFSFDISAEAYEQMIADILQKEICGGEGSSFVTPRKLSGRVKDFSLSKALTIYRRLLDNEFGAYWKFMFYDGRRVFLGATPEKHLVVGGGVVKMNPISGTFRKRGDHTAASLKQELLAFLQDKKEIDELFMVTDEELKLMCKICPQGGRIEGPLLKEMSQLVHTEYLLEGDRAGRDAIECFRLSMYAPTVTGSPMGNACARLYEYERDSRMYYSSACVLLGHEAAGGANGHAGTSADRQHQQQVGSAARARSRSRSREREGKASSTVGAECVEEFLDSCITIRTQEFHMDGAFDIRVGATLVKDSVAGEEVRETEWKLKAAMRSLQTEQQATKRPLRLMEDAFTSPADRQALQQRLLERNGTVSNFWLAPSGTTQGSLVDADLAGRRVLLMNNEDDFAHMLEHMLCRLGLQTECVPFDQFESRYLATESALDLCVVGPGPGDPSSEVAKMKTVKANVRRLLGPQGKRFLAVCLGHQCTGHVLGLEVRKKEVPLQGVQKEVDLFGRRERVGFYNSFYVQHCPLKCKDIAASMDDATGELYGLRAADRLFVSFQFHPESMLSQNGLSIVRNAVRYLLDLPPVEA